jgi:hypothetical protein
LLIRLFSNREIGKGQRAKGKGQRVKGSRQWAVGSDENSLKLHAIAAPFVNAVNFINPINFSLYFP